MQNHLKNELRYVISGKSQVSHGAVIQAIAGYLADGTQAGPKAEIAKQERVEEARKLTAYISQHELWITDIDFTQYVSEGAEQRVFLKDAAHVIKLNDAIYYSCWKDYFHNLLFHNFFFPDTAYQLIGFAKENDVLYAVVQQAYVKATAQTDLKLVKVFLEANGFLNTKNNDYHHKEFGIILEDLHDENVLIQHGVLYFIDTVFYATEVFWIGD